MQERHNVSLISQRLIPCFIARELAQPSHRIFQRPRNYFRIFMLIFHLVASDPFCFMCFMFFWISIWYQKAILESYLCLLEKRFFCGLNLNHSFNKHQIKREQSGKKSHNFYVRKHCDMTSAARMSLGFNCLLIYRHKKSFSIVKEK